jgi:multidrug efflux pump subunit AcrA (membrane-fusion protein)
VDKIHVKNDDIVKANTKLFTLKDTQSRVSYDTLLRQRTELEEDFLELLRIQHFGAVVSPVSGRVCSTDDSGEKAEIAVISLDQQMSVTIDVDEADILSLQIGQRVEVTVNSAGNDPYSGVLTQINRTINSGSYSAEVTLEKGEGMLSGMTADVRIEILCTENVVVIPAKAVNLTQTGAYVYTGCDPDTGKYENRVDVVIGLEGEGFVEIKEGLQAGDRVYYTDAATVKDLFDSMGGRDEHQSTEAKDEATTD